MIPTARRPHRLPGAWLITIARVLFHATVLEQVLQPTIVDLQNEWIEAGDDRRARRLARLRGYVAFWSLVFMAPVAFRNWTNQTGNAGGFFQLVWRFEMTMATRIRFTALLIALGLGVGYGASYLRPVLYESTAVVQIVPARVAPSLIDPANVPPTIALEERLTAVVQMLLSRTRLERLINEFGLYKNDGLVIQDAVELMQRRTRFRPSTLAVRQIVVSFADRDPKAALRVAEKMTSMVIDESLRDAERRAENTAAFLDSQVEESRRQLEALSLEVTRGRGGASLPKRLELDVLQTRYKALLVKRADAQTFVSMERRQIGEQFNLIDPARLPARPVGPTRLEFALAGGAAGLAAAVLFMLVAGAWRLHRDRRLLRPTTA